MNMYTDWFEWAKSLSLLELRTQVKVLELVHSEIMDSVEFSELRHIKEVLKEELMFRK